MKTITIKAKIAGLVATSIAGLALVVTMVYVRTASKLEESDYHDVVEMKDLVADVLPPPLYVLEAESVALDVVRATDKAVILDLRTRWKVLEKEFNDRQAYWSARLAPGSLRSALLEGAAPLGHSVFEIGNDQLFPALLADDHAKAEAAVAAIKDRYTKHRAKVDEVVRGANLQSDASIAAAASAISSRKRGFVLVGLGVALIGSLLGFLVVRDVSRRMRSTSDLLDGVSKGDLTLRLEIASEDEIGKMGASLNRTLDAIESALAEVQRVAGTVAEAAARLSSQSEQISSGAQEQASSLEETAASLEQITATVKQSSGNAQQASQLAMTSREVAHNGGAVVQESVAAMNEITRASQRIGDIITTIDEIALQTNLLALNAAVEAARAGEQGRGFAVVASEVGNLAQRSAGAAKEVKALIQDTLGRVATGQRLVDQSGRTLQEIIVSVKKVTDIVGDIAAAAREQSAGVDQVNQAVSQMDQVTQSNAGQTEGLARTAEGLSENAAQLRDQVSRFRLTTRGGGGRRGARANGSANGARVAAAGVVRKERHVPVAQPSDADWELANGDGAGATAAGVMSPHTDGDDGASDGPFESV